MKRHMLKVALPLLCLLLSALAFRGTLDAIPEILGQQALNTRNDQYLTASFNKALAGFGVMSAFKAGLDIIEGSEVGASVGVTVQLQVGDIVQPAYDYVDLAWRTLLAGCIALLSLQYLLKAAAFLDGPVLGIAFLLLALFLALRAWRPGWSWARAALRDALCFCTVIALTLYYLLPLSVFGASRLSALITRPSIDQAEKGFRDTKDQLFPETAPAADGVVAKLKQLQDRIEQIAEGLKQKTREMVVWTIQLITGYLFDCILFPLLFFILLLGLVRSLMRYILQRSAQLSLRHDLRRLLAERGPGKNHPHTERDC